MIAKIREKINIILNIFSQIVSIHNRLVRVQEALGRIELRQLESLDKLKLQDNEFRVFSQFGEDGIIQMILRHIEVPNKIFIEFGVEDYTESNTRFLLVNDNWSGLVIDGNPEHISHIKQDFIYWQYNLKAVLAFINKDNINEIIDKNGLKGEIGILSIDIDGNDYWIWQAIDIVTPAIVIIEYNFRFGKDKSVTVPYSNTFVRSHAHYSNIYYGASLKALYTLANRKGYAFIGCNSSGSNAFFVRRDIKPDSLKELSVDEGFVSGQFRESRNEKGNLLYLSSEEEQKMINSLPLIEIL